MYWFMHSEVLRELEAFSKSGLVCTAEQQEKFLARWDTAREKAEAADGPRILKIAGAEAEIVIEGPLVKRPMMMLYLFGRGFTTYDDIRDSLARAALDPTVKSVTLRIDSPGGQVDGLFDTLAAIDSFEKPIKTRAINAHSASYAIAAMTSKIEATSQSSMFGSVGVATSFYFWQGEESIDLTNTGSPDKRPDPRTDAGKAVIVRELDALNDLLVDAIARGRTAAGKPIKAAAVNEAFGRGASFLAAEAQQKSMIDKVAQPRLRGTRAQEDNKDPEAVAPGTAPNAGKDETAMDIKTLMTTYPALCQELIEQGKKSGAETERDRVVGHLTLAENGDMETAVAAIKDGSGMTATIHAKHMKAAMSRNDQAARQTETDKAAAAATGSASGTGGAGGSGTGAAGAAGAGAELDAGDRVVAALEKSGYLKPEKKPAA